MPTRTRKQARRRTARRPDAGKRRPASAARQATAPKTAQRAAARVPGASAATGIAPGMQPVNTCLAVANVAATMAFLERAFGFRRGVILPDGNGAPRYAEMRHGPSAIMLVPRGDAATATAGVPAIYAYVGDVDATLARAREAGGAAGDAEDKPWGDRTAAVVDPDGYRWVLATFRKLAPFQGEGERRSGVERRRGADRRKEQPG